MRGWYALRAYSTVVVRPVCIRDAGVRFSIGPHFRKAQGIGSRLASLGGQLVLNFGRKNQLAILQNAVRADIFKKCCHFCPVF